MVWRELLASNVLWKDHSGHRLRVHANGSVVVNGMESFKEKKLSFFYHRFKMRLLWDSVETPEIRSRKEGKGGLVRVW